MDTGSSPAQALAFEIFSMDLVQAIVIGFLQGVTEFLPISSSGHLILLPKIVGWQDQGLMFDVLLHSATLLALLVVFWRDLIKIARGFVGKHKKERVLGWWIIIGSVPAAIAGFFGAAFFETIRGVQVVAFSLIFWGIIMWLADYIHTSRGVKITFPSDTAQGRRSGRKKLKALRWHHALGIGVAQAVALIPGTSRSGITITAGLVAGMNRKESVQFSFLLGIPVFFGATILKVIDAAQNGIDSPLLVLIVGFVVAFIVGIFAIKFLLRFVTEHNLTVFVVYRIVLGVLMLSLL